MTSNLYPLYDGHNHLQDASLLPHITTVLADCKASGVQRMVVNGTCEKDWPLVAELAQQHPCVLAAFGLHPWKIKERTSKWNSTLEQYLKKTPGVVGEIGLDRWVEDFDIDDQIAVFETQWQMAVDLDLPVTVHCLKAWGILHEKLRAYRRARKGFLLHSYNGSAELIQPLADLGGYFSISGYFAQEKKKKHRDVLQHIPLDRLLLETDAPNMLPPKHLNSYPIDEYKTNHPANIKSVYAFCAQLFGVTDDQLKERVAKNFKTFFGSLTGDAVSEK